MIFSQTCASLPLTALLLTTSAVRAADPPLSGLCSRKDGIQPCPYGGQCIIGSCTQVFDQSTYVPGEEVQCTSDPKSASCIVRCQIWGSYYDNKFQDSPWYNNTCAYPATSPNGTKAPNPWDCMRSSSGPYQPDGTLEVCDSDFTCRKRFFPYRPQACSPKYQQCGIIDGPGHHVLPMKPVKCMKEGEVCVQDPRGYGEICVPGEKRCGGRNSTLTSSCAEDSEQCVFEKDAGKGAGKDAVGYCMKMLVKVRDN